MKKAKSEWREANLKDGQTMRVYVASPEGPGPFPLVIVLQEIFGVNSHIREVTERLASCGYIGVAPELFHRTAPPGTEFAYSDIPSARPHAEGLSLEKLTEDLESTYSLMHGDVRVDRKRAAAIGFCLGGKGAIQAAEVLLLKAAISFYGSRIPTLQAKVESLAGPVLLFWGGRDAHIDLAQRESARQMLRDAKKPFTDVEFSDADHGFFCSERSSYHASSARQAWVLVTQFLEDCFANV